MDMMPLSKPGGRASMPFRHVSFGYLASQEGNGIRARTGVPAVACREWPCCIVMRKSICRLSLMRTRVLSWTTAVEEVNKTCNLHNFSSQASEVQMQPSGETWRTKNPLRTRQPCSVRSA